jgi:hypothetical protein
MLLIVYRCYDNREEESMFLVNSEQEAKDWLDTNPARPIGFESRDGYYFFESHDC